MNYTNKKQKLRKGMFARLDYIPNKLIYITEIEKNHIHFIGFYKEAGDPFNFRPSAIIKQCKNEIKTIDKCYKPNEIVKKVLNNYLKNKL